MDTTEIRRLAAEVSVQHGIRIDPDDPMMAVVTLNRLVLEAALSETLQSFRTASAEFNQAAERVQIRVGSAVAQEVRESAAAIREELQKDIDKARLSARELIVEAQRTQSRHFLVRWIAIGVLGGAVLFAAGFYFGTLIR
jgi:hypothetical protein